MELFEKLDKALKNLYSIFKKEAVKVNKIMNKSFIGAPEGSPPYRWEKTINIDGKEYILVIEDDSYMTSSVIKLIMPNGESMDIYPKAGKKMVYYTISFALSRPKFSKVSDLNELKNELEITDQDLEELINKINLLAVECV